MTKVTTEMAVIGGGVIGLATALRLRAEGRDVAVIEPNEPGSGASYGNAGTVADYAIIPVGTPSVLKNLASLLLDTDSPLAIRKTALPTLFPWLMRFAYESLPHRYRDNASRIADLVSDASSEWLDLAAEIGASDLLSAALVDAARRNGCVFLQAAATEITRRRGSVQIAAAPFDIDAKSVVIAAGAHSGKFATQVEDPVRLDTERGYHLEFDMAQLPIERPVCPTHHGFYFCPMNGRLRIAGTVELGGLAAPSNPRRLQVLLTNARRISPSRADPGWASVPRCLIPFRSSARQEAATMSSSPLGTVISGSPSRHARLAWSAISSRPALGCRGRRVDR